jgi:hypothetical protein
MPSANEGLDASSIFLVLTAKGESSGLSSKPHAVHAGHRRNADPRGVGVCVGVPENRRFCLLAVSVLSIDNRSVHFFRPRFCQSSRWLRCVLVPSRSRSAIQASVIVASRRNRSAIPENGLTRFPEAGRLRDEEPAGFSLVRPHGHQRRPQNGAGAESRT